MLIGRFAGSMHGIAAFYSIYYHLLQTHTYKHTGARMCVSTYTVHTHVYFYISPHLLFLYVILGLDILPLAKFIKGQKVCNCLVGKHCMIGTVDGTNQCYLRGLLRQAGLTLEADAQIRTSINKNYPSSHKHRK